MEQENPNTGDSGRESDNTIQNPEMRAIEHVIRYEDGIKSDFVLASCSVPINYAYARLNVETRNLTVETQGDVPADGDNDWSKSPIVEPTCAFSGMVAY